MGIRARSFATRMGDDFQIGIRYRSGHKILATLRFYWFLLRVRPALCYVFDMSFSGVLAAGLHRILSSCQMVVDTGDAIYELSLSSGTRGRVGLWLTRLLEQLSFSLSDQIIVRSHPHQELLARRHVLADVVPDGVDPEQFSPRRDDGLRLDYKLEGFTVVGVLGSLVWNPRWQMCYGWELIEAIGLLRDRSVKGLIIGDGSGLPELKKRCAALGLQDRIVFVGRVPYEDLPAYLGLMDICLSTQTNDAAGQVRTTGKLPLYLACGRFVLASEVGEAARVLPPEMLVPYQGTKDTDYPRRLAQRIRLLLDGAAPLEQSAAIAIAKIQFDYDLLAAKLRNILNGLLLQRLANASPPPAYGNTPGPPPDCGNRIVKGSGPRP
jgi:glycosyltransferase involved in cell wall biosynthesis